MGRSGPLLSPRAAEPVRGCACGQASGGPSCPPHRPPTVRLAGREPWPGGLLTDPAIGAVAGDHWSAALSSAAIDRGVALFLLRVARRSTSSTTRGHMRRTWTLRSGTTASTSPCAARPCAPAVTRDTRVCIAAARAAMQRLRGCAPHRCIAPHPRAQARPQWVGGARAQDDDPAAREPVLTHRLNEADGSLLWEWSDRRRA